MRKIREERGSITLFVLISMLFFLLFLTGVYMVSANRESTVLAETGRIKEIYEQDINQIDDVYETLEDKRKLIADGRFNGTVNTPKLTDNMKAVYWDGDSWERPETQNQWYEYKAQTGTTQDGGDSRWANATLQNGSYFVWIPRYAYKIVNGYHQSGEQINSSSPTLGAGEIDIIFLKGKTNKDKDGNTISSDYIVHPAFDFGGAQEGIWVGKYESSDDGSGKVKIVPNVTSYRDINVSTMFSKAQTMAGENNLSSVDTHMMKNTEWGCVAYLAHSKYGRNGTEVTINNSSEYITGAAGSSPTDTITSANGTYAYNSPNGQLASTTGNITGVYDMNGGSWEYVTGNLLSNTEETLIGTIGSAGTTETFNKIYTQNDNTLKKKYFNLYNYSGISGESGKEPNYQANTSKVGDAIFETSTSGTGSTSWFFDYSYYVDSTYPWFIRGGYYGGGIGSGVFYFSYDTGGSNRSISFRVMLIPE